MHARQPNLRKILPLFLMIFLPAALLIAGMGTWYVHEQGNVVLQRYQVEARHHVEGQMNRVRRFYRQGMAVLLALARDKAAYPALTGDVNARRGIAEAFSDIMRISEMYDQIRLLDSSGREVVRVDRRGDSPHVISSGQLQDKGQRDYVRQTLALSRGAVYVSPFDLNVEHGKVERPYKAMIRFATPLVDDNGIKVGVLVINILGINIMQRELSETELEGEHLLINAGAPYWFDRHMDELHVLEDMNDVVQSHRLSKGWLHVLKEDNGQFAAAEGQFTFESMAPASFSMASRTLILPQWQIVSFVPAAALAAAAGAFTSQAMAICITAIVLIGFIIGLWSRRYTMQHRAEQAIEHSEARLKLAEQDMDMGYWDWDMLSDTVTWSDGFKRIFGFNGTHVTSTFATMAPYVHPDDLESLKAAVVEASRSDDRHETEFRITREDGKERYIHVSGQVIFTEGTRPARMFGTMHDITKRKEAEKERETLTKANRRLAQGLIKAREEERSRLARALHDDIGQKLAAIQMQAAAVVNQCLNKNCPEAQSGMQTIQNTASDIISTIRSQLKQLRPPQMDELGFKAAIASLCRHWRENSGVDCHLRVGDAADALNDDVCLSLYRVVQEALTNIMRHAGASEVHVNLGVKEDGVRLTIRDNGCGFDPDAQTDGIGLIGLHERMDLLGGSMYIESAPGKGTRLVFHIPVLSSA